MHRLSLLLDNYQLSVISYQLLISYQLSVISSNILLTSFDFRIDVVTATTVAFALTSPNLCLRHSL